MRQTSSGFRVCFFEFKDMEGVCLTSDRLLRYDDIDDDDNNYNHYRMLIDIEMIRVLIIIMIIVMPQP